MEDNKNLVEVKNLEVSFFTYAGEVKAVRGISYNLKPGEVMGIVGESGSGKSVSSYGLMGIIPEPGKVIGGRILFEGRDVTAMSEKELLKIRGKDISMIFQDPMTSLNPLFTIGNQIEESLRKHTSLDKDQRQKRMVELLTLVGINQPEKRLKQYPHEFSGGMRQRVMIAMALACDPKLLIADEPTTALDVTIQAQILELLKELKDKIHMGHRVHYPRSGRRLRYLRQHQRDVRGNHCGERQQRPDLLRTQTSLHLGAAGLRAQDRHG